MEQRPKPQHPVTAASRANLVPPWKPGESGNPGGRPKKRPITDEYAQILSEPVPELIRLQINQFLGVEFLSPGATFARAQALRRALDSLLQGGWQASKEMREAIEGKAPMRMEIVGTERKEVTLKVVFEKRNNGTFKP